MDILKTAIEWAKDEVFSSWIFILFGILFVSTAIIFWQIGKTDLSKAFIIPILISGGLLLAAGFGFYFSNKARISNFENEYHNDITTFISTESNRVEKTILEYENIAFRIFPIIMIIAASLIIFIDKPLWRAISMTTLGLLMVILMIDSHAHARLKNYYKQLQQEQNS